MKPFRKILFFATILGLVLSCTKPDGGGVVKLNVSSTARGADASYFWVGVEASGSWTLQLLSLDGNPVSWIRLETAQGSGNSQVKCSYDANSSGEQRSTRLILSGENGSKDALIIVQQGYSPPSPMPGWLELPASKAGLEFVSHTFDYTSGGITRKLRNYSYAYSASDRLAIWVAYPLNSFYTFGSADRDKSSWQMDMKLPESIRYSQPSLDLGAYGKGAYDRGHQCPAADRKCSQSAMNQTFYCTNATPQKGTFNQGIWSNFEGRVRAYSNKCDTLYVVTGCVMDGYLSTVDKAGKTCPVPGHYFKALLARGGSKLGTKGWAMAGFYFDPEKSYSSIDSSVPRSIDEIETLTGLDLFPNLADIIGATEANALEAEKPQNNKFWEL